MPLIADLDCMGITFCYARVKKPSGQFLSLIMMSH
jgi:hypothetical protein